MPEAGETRRLRAAGLFFIAVVGSVCIALAALGHGEANWENTSVGNPKTKLGQMEILSTVGNCPPPCVPHVFDQQEESEMEGLMGKGKIVLPSNQEAVQAAINAATDADSKATAAAGSPAAGFVQPQVKQQAQALKAAAAPSSKAVPGQYVSQWQQMHPSQPAASRTAPAAGYTVVTASGQGQPVTAVEAQETSSKARAGSAYSTSGMVGSSGESVRQEERSEARGGYAAYNMENRGRSDEYQRGAVDERRDSGEYDHGVSRRGEREGRHGEGRDRRGDEREGDGEQGSRMAAERSRLSRNSRLGALLRLFVKSHAEEGQRGERRERRERRERSGGEEDREGYFGRRTGGYYEGREEGGRRDEERRRYEARGHVEDTRRRNEEGFSSSSLSSSALERLLRKMVQGREHDRYREHGEREERLETSERRDYRHDDGRGGTDSRASSRHESTRGGGALGRMLSEMGMGVGRSSGRAEDSSEVGALRGLTLSDVMRKLQRAERER